MKIDSTAEISARRVLWICVFHFKVEPRIALPFSKIEQVWFYDGSWNAEELKEGIDYGVEVGWLSLDEPYQCISLTPAGIIEA